MLVINNMDIFLDKEDTNMDWYFIMTNCVSIRKLTQGDAEKIRYNEINKFKYRKYNAIIKI